MQYLLSLLLLCSTVKLYSQQLELVLPLVHTEMCNGTFSNDNKLLLTYSDKIILWHGSAARIQRIIETEKQHVTLAAFTKKNAAIVALYGGSVKLFDTETGNKLWELKGHTSPMYKASISKDGTKLITAGEDKMVMIWDLANKKIIKTIKVYDKRLTVKTAISPNGFVAAFISTMINQSRYQQLNVYDLRSGKLIIKKKDMELGSELYLDDTQLILANNESTSFFSLTNWKEKIIDRQNVIGYHTFSPNGKLAASDNRTFNRNATSISVTNLATQESKELWQNGAIAYAFTSDSTLMSADNEGNIFYWNLNNEENNYETGSDFTPRNIRGKQLMISSTDRKRIAWINVNDRQMKLYIWSQGKFISNYDNGGLQVTDVYASPSGDSIFFNNERSFKLWQGTKILNVPTTDLLDDHKKELKYWMKKMPNAPYDELGTVNVDWLNKRVLSIHQMLQDSIKVTSLASGEKLDIHYEREGDSSEYRGYGILEIGKGSWVLPYSRYLGYQYFRLSDDSKSLFTAYNDGSFRVWDVATHQVLLTDSISIERDITGMKFLTGDTTISIILSKDSVFRYSISDKLKFLYARKPIDEENNFFVQNTSGTQLLNTDGNLIDLATGTTIEHIPVGGDKWMRFSNDDKLLAYETNDHDIIIRDMERKKVVSSLNGNNASIMSIQFCRNNTRFLTSRNDNTVQLWDIQTGNLIATFCLFGESDFIVYIPSGYYMGSRKAVNNMSYKINGKLYPIAQFDLRFNRPDKVLKALGTADEVLLRNYFNAWEKRVKRAGLSPVLIDSSFHTPDINIKNANALPPIISTSRIKLQLQAEDSKYNLSRIDVLINSVPVWTSKSLSEDKMNQWIGNVDVALSNGNNSIEVTCSNVAGVESSKEVISIFYQPVTEKKQMTWFVGIGVSQYRDSSMNLKYASKDVHDLDSDLKEQYGDTYKSLLLTDGSATKENIITLKKYLQGTNIDDIVIISISGHGLTTADNKFCFATVDMDFDDPLKRGLLYDSLEWILDNIPARKKLLLIDACHSGELEEQITIIKGNTNVKEYDKKGITIKTTAKGRSMQNTFELMKEAFADLQKSSGTVVVSAAGGLEYAYEDAKFSNGVFTYCIREALRSWAANYNADENISVNELRKYVSQKVEELTNGRQRPTARRELMDDWIVW